MIDLKEAFPDVDPGIRPVGYKILVQLKRVAEKTKGGIILAADTRDADQAVAVVGRIVALGGSAYRDRITGNRWVDYPWVEVGQFVRVPRFGGDRFVVEGVPFAVINDEDVIAVVTDEAAIS